MRAPVRDVRLVGGQGPLVGTTCFARAKPIVRMASGEFVIVHRYDEDHIEGSAISAAEWDDMLASDDAFALADAELRLNHGEFLWLFRPDFRRLFPDIDVAARLGALARRVGDGPEVHSYLVQEDQAELERNDWRRKARERVLERARRTRWEEAASYALAESDLALGLDVALLAWILLACERTRDHVRADRWRAFALRSYGQRLLQDASVLRTQLERDLESGQDEAAWFPDRAALRQQQVAA